MSSKLQQLLSTLDIPQPCQTIIRRVGQDHLAVRREDRSGDACILTELTHLLPGLHVPERCRSVLPASDQRILSIWRKRDPGHIIRVFGELADQLPALDIPQACGAVNSS